MTPSPYPPRESASGPSSARRAEYNFSQTPQPRVRLLVTPECTGVLARADSGAPDARTGGGKRPACTRGWLRLGWCVEDEGLPSRSHCHQKSCHPLCPHPPRSDLPIPVSLKHQHVLASWGSAPQPHTRAAPVATTTLPPTPAHTDPSPPTVCLGPQPPTCHGAVPPSPPLPPVSGRQLQVCPLLSEQVDSDAQSHKPWVGMKFLSFSH